MAGIQERSDGYRIPCRYHGKPHALTLGKVSEDEARSKPTRSAVPDFDLHPR